MFVFKATSIWSKTMALTAEGCRWAYALSETERCGLVPQLRRAAIFIVSHFAERYGRYSRNDYRRVLTIARDSVREVAVAGGVGQAMGWASGAVPIVAFVDSVAFELNRLLKSARNLT